MGLFNTTIEIGGKTYKVPERISVAQFEGVQTWGIESQAARIMCISTITGAPVADIKTLTDDEIEMTFAMASLSMKSIENPKPYDGPLDFNNITFGQFVDLDVITYEDLNTHLAQAISIIWNCTPEEVRDEPLDKYLSGLGEWAECRAKVYTQFSEFFGLGEDHQQAAEDLDIDIEAADIKRTWYQAIITLAGEDFLKMNSVVERPVIECMNYLAYMKDQAKKREAELKKQQAKMTARKH